MCSAKGRWLFIAGRCIWFGRGFCGATPASRNFCSSITGWKILEVPVRIGFDADFADIFEVRGTVQGTKRRATRRTNQAAIPLFCPTKGLDRVVRQTCIRSDAHGVRASEAGLEFEVVLRPKERATVEFEVCCSSETGNRLYRLYRGVCLRLASNLRNFPVDFLKSQVRTPDSATGSPAPFLTWR